MSTQNASGFLAALGKDDTDEDDVPRRRKKKAAAAPADTAPPAPAEEAPAPEAPAPDPVPEPPAQLTASQQRAAERRTVVEDVPVPVAPTVASTRPRIPEPVHKTSVDLRWSLKTALGDLCDRDRRGPKAELNDALEAHLRAKGIEITEWEG